MTEIISSFSANILLVDIHQSATSRPNFRKLAPQSRAQLWISGPLLQGPVDDFPKWISRGGATRLWLASRLYFSLSYLAEKCNTLHNDHSAHVMCPVGLRCVLPCLWRHATQMKMFCGYSCVGRCSRGE